MNTHPHPSRQNTACGVTTSPNNINQKKAPSKGGSYHQSNIGNAADVRTTRKASHPVGKTSEGNEEQQLLVSRKEVCRLLGNISARSVARLEERGLLRSTGLLRHKLYRRADVEALANEELNWEA